MNNGRFKKGQSAWNKDKKMPKSMGLKMSLIASKRTGQNSPRWQETPSYNAVHLWLRKTYGSAIKCEECEKKREEGMIHWANVSQKYLRDRTDWKQLCVPCHKQLDKPWLKLQRDSKGKFKKNVQRL